MGLSGLSTRTRGWFRLAVSAATEEEALERASTVRKLFAPQITIARPADQYAVAREFIPGERLGTTAYRRRMPVTTLAAAVPAATAKVGDRVGIHLGETSGTSSRVVTWEPWEMTERGEESGLAVLCAGLGGGKSTAGGNIIYRTADAGGAVDGARPLRPADRPVPDAGAGRALPGRRPPRRRPRRAQHLPGDRRPRCGSTTTATSDWRAAKDHAADTRRLLTSQRAAGDAAPADAGPRAHRGGPDAGRREGPRDAHLLHHVRRRRARLAWTGTPSSAGTPATWPTSCGRPPRPATAG